MQRHGGPMRWKTQPDRLLETGGHDLPRLGLRVVIFLDDHDPAHVHVFGDGEVKINLAGPAASPKWSGQWVRSAPRFERRWTWSRRIARTSPHAGGRSMAELTDDEIDAALERGRSLQAAEPRAMAARFDPRTGKITLDLTNGCTFVFPARLIQGLENTPDADLAAVDLLPQGRGLHWEGPDVDISIPGLVNGVFGTRAHMARTAGESKSPAKTAASRANGAKGGRPRKAAG
jgi:hypothetical protein